MSIDPDLESRLTSHLRAAADRSDGTSAPLDEVRERGRRIRRRRRAITTVGAFTAVAAMAATVALVSGTIGGGGEELTVGPPVSGDATEPPEQTTPTDSGATQDGAADSPPVTADPVSPIVVRPAPDGWGVAEIAHEDRYDEHLVVWGEGLARVTTEWTEAPIEPLPDALIALFPEEVHPFFADPSPAALEAGEQLLLERPELLDEIDRVIAAHPEIAGYLYGGPSESTLIVETTIDGRTWTAAGALTVPGEGAGWVQFLMSTGDRLVAVVQGWPGPADPEPQVLVASSTDLVTWDTIEVLEPAPTEPPPPGFRSDRWLQHADLAPDGSIVVTANDGVTLDVESLLPADLRARTDEGYGMWTTDEGVVLSFPGDVATTVDDGWEENAPTTGWGSTAPDDGEEIVLTWAELGIDPEVARSIDRSNTVTMWGGPIGSIRAITSPLTHGWNIGALAMPGGGVVVIGADDVGNTNVWHTADGRSWQQRSLPVPGSAWVSSMFRVGDRIAVSVDGPDGLRWFHADGAGRDWTGSGRLQLDGIEETHLQVDPRWQAWHPMVGHVVVLRIEPIMAIDWSVEADGFRYESSLGPWSEARLVRIGIDGAADQIVVEIPPIGSDELVSWTGSGITINDPGTGDPIVTFTHDAIDAAIAAATGGVDPYLTPVDAQMVVLVDPDSTGETWYELDRFPAVESWPSVVAATDDLVLISIEGPDGVSLRSYRLG